MSWKVPDVPCSFWNVSTAGNTDIRETGMWKHSRASDYNNFRTFIFGITKQSMFPNGVVYEGVSDEPMYFRGESGANDSMVRGKSCKI